MKLLKATTLFSVSLASLIAFSNASFAATSDSSATQPTTITQSNNLIKAQGVPSFWFYFNPPLPVNSSLTDSERLTVASDSTTVTVEVTQWVVSYNNGNQVTQAAKLNYELINVDSGKSAGTKEIFGEYRNTTGFTSWSGVKKGTYKLKITNIGVGPANGNGKISAN
ncbi:hypothetical protein [Paenibacillus chitinolyticus]|uniref:hypothetical protein n=1 Tax=Paenibacillus chitinolyticus TaxID=79263 RepID=UPI0036712C2F